MKRVLASLGLGAWAPEAKPNPGLIFPDLGTEELWCCGFSSDLKVRAGNSIGPAKEWVASVPDDLIRATGETGGWAFMEDPDRLVRLDGSLPITGPSQTLYSAAQREKP